MYVYMYELQEYLNDPGVFRHTAFTASVEGDVATFIYVRAVALDLCVAA
jgi:hypothetical protein